MNFLLVNDDGYLAPGLNSFKKFLEKYGKVYVVAPHSWQSGKSIGISFFLNLAVHQIDETTWSVEGTPAERDAGVQHREDRGQHLQGVPQAFAGIREHYR